ncbi:MAG: uroporphyrinogen-III synthase [Pseudomonadota bacterium]
MKPLVWVTRPDGQSEATVQRVKEMGWEALVAPLLKVEHLPATALEGAHYDAIVLTSANGVPALQVWAQAKPDLHALPVITTGKSTAQAAEAAGFENVFPIEGPAPKAFSAVPSHLGNDAFSVLYPCAQKTAHDAAKLAQENGLTCTAIPVYATQPVTALPDKVRAAWMAGKLDAVLLYSPRTAGTLAKLMANMPQNPPLMACLSEAIAQALPDAWQKQALWPASPVQDLLFQRLAEALNKDQ